MLRKAAIALLSRVALFPFFQNHSGRSHRLPAFVDPLQLYSHNSNSTVWQFPQLRFHNYGSTMNGALCAICCLDTPSFTLMVTWYRPGTRLASGIVFSSVN
jgi:hypothetical protein